MARKRQEKTAIARRGLMLVLSSPSGAGKTTLSRRLLELDDNVMLSISVTTRKKRPSEIHGRDYYFIERRDFDELVASGELLEWAEVFDNYYGTPKKPVPLGIPTMNFRREPARSEKIQAAVQNKRTGAKPEPLGIPRLVF